MLEALLLNTKATILSLQIQWPHDSHKLAFYDLYIRDYLHEPEFDVYDKAYNMAFVDGDVASAMDLVRQTNVIDKNFLKLNIVTENKKLLYTSRRILSVETVMGTVGGILNLWVGITFITLVELIEFAGAMANKLKKQAPKCKTISPDKQEDIPHIQEISQTPPKV